MDGSDEGTESDAHEELVITTGPDMVTTQARPGRSCSHGDSWQIRWMVLSHIALDGKFHSAILLTQGYHTMHDQNLGEHQPSS